MHTNEIVVSLVYIPRISQFRLGITAQVSL